MSTLHPIRRQAVQTLYGPGRRTLFANGLKVLFVEDRHQPLVHIDVKVRVGSTDEIPGKTGIAHYGEHNVGFNGTRTRKPGQIDAEVQFLGGQISARTEWNQTVFSLLLPSHHTSQGLEILMDAMRHSTFPRHSFRQELRAIMQEEKDMFANPGMRLMRDLWTATFPAGHPMGRPIGGFMDDVKRLTRADIQSFYETWYVPNNMNWIIMGDFDTDDAERTLAKLSHGFKPRTLPARPRLQTPSRCGVPVTVFRADTQRVQAIFMVPLPPVRHADTPALALLLDALSHGIHSPLYQVLEGTNLATGWNLMLHCFDGGTAWQGNLEATVENFPAAFCSFLGVLAQSTRGLWPNHHLQRAKNDYFLGYQRAESLLQRACELSSTEELYGAQHLTHIRRFSEKMDSITPAEIRRIAGQYLAPAKITAVVNLPKKGLDEESARQWQNELPRFIDAAFDPQFNNHLRRKRIPTCKPQVRLRRFSPAVILPVTHAESNLNGTTKRHRLSNGVEIICLQRGVLPRFSLVALWEGGHTWESPATQGIASHHGALWTHGLTHPRSGVIDRIGLKERLANMDASIGAHTEYDNSSLGLSGLSAHLRKAVELFCGVLRFPHFPADDIEHRVENLLTYHAHRAEHPETWIEDEFFKLLFAGHPYGFSLFRSKAALKRLTPDMLRDFHHRFILPGRFVLGAAGNFNENRLIETLEKHLGDLGSSAPSSRVNSPPAANTQPRALHLRGPRDEVRIALGFLGPQARQPDAYAAEVLASILHSSSGTGRLFEKLRVQEGLCYGVSGAFCGLQLGGYFQFTTTVAPTNRDAALQAIRQVLSEAHQEPPSEHEVAAAKNSLLVQTTIAYQGTRATAHRLARAGLLGQPFLDLAEQRQKKILAVTAEQVQSVAAQTFTQPETLVTLGP